MHSAVSSCVVQIHVGKSAAFGIHPVAHLLGKMFFARNIQCPCTGTLVSASIQVHCPDRPEVVRVNCLLACRQGAELLKDGFWQNQVWCE